MKPKEYEQLISSISQELTNDPQLRNLEHKRFGRKNQWEGASGFLHQIDVSIHNDNDVLLIECKAWESGIRAIEFLTFLSRIIDIRGNPKNQGINIRGAIVTTRKWQSGVKKLADYYCEVCSAYVVTEDKKITKIIHTHFIKPVSIASGEVFGRPTITQSP